MTMMGGMYCFGKSFEGLTTASFEDFQFDVVNQMTYTQMTGKSEPERNAVAHMLSLIKNSEHQSVQEARGTTFVGDQAVQQQAANDLLYAILALNTSGRARQIVEENLGRNGVEAWVRLRERFGKTTGATTYVEICKFNWSGSSSFEDKWRLWVEKISRLPSGALSDAAKEALAIEGALASGQTALEQHLR